MKTIQNIVAITILSLLVSCGNNEEKSQKEVSNNSPAIVVKVKTVVDNTNSPFITASGKVQAVNSAELSTRMMGFVEKIHINVGDRVKKGQLLLSINNSDLQAKKAQVLSMIIKAKAGFKIAEKDYNRYKNLFNQKSASQKELDDMTAHYEMAKAGLEAAKQMKNEINAQFAYSNIKAPFSGIVTSKMIDKGAMANPGMPLISIEGKRGFEVMAMVPENEISKIKKEAKVTVLVKSISKTLTGKVSEVSISAKHTGGQYLVKINLDKTETKILSGMFATVLFPLETEVATAQDIVLIPLEAIVKKGELRGVYTVSQNNKALLRWLRLGKVFPNQTEVLSGLAKGERYILSANGKLYNGANILIQ